MKRFYIKYIDHNQGHQFVSWLYIYAYSERQLRDMFVEYDIITIKDSEYHNI